MLEKIKQKTNINIKFITMMNIIVQANINYICLITQYVCARYLQINKNSISLLLFHDI